MPIIARFYSILIKMYYIEDEHNPPHIHAKYNEYEGISILQPVLWLEAIYLRMLNTIEIDFCQCGRIKILKNYHLRSKPWII